MILLICMATLGTAFGAMMPLRWGVFGFLGALAVLFMIHAGLNAASGFAGSSFEESLLLFNGSVVSYLGFNLQITYRAFALPMLAVATPLVFRLARSLRRD